MPLQTARSEQIHSEHMIGTKITSRAIRCRRPHGRLRGTAEVALGPNLPLIKPVWISLKLRRFVGLPVAKGDY